MPGCDGAGTAERSYTASEVSGGLEETPGSEVRGGGREELPSVRGQWRLGGDTPRPRSGAASRSHLTPEARSGSWEEPEARANGWEEQPEERWLRRHRRA